MRLKKSKKGVLGYLTMFILVLAIITFIIYSNAFGDEGEDRTIGEIQMNLLKQVKEGEKILLYIDESAKMASGQAFYDLARYGGFHNESVPEDYFGFTVWDYKTSQLPVKVLENFSIYMNTYLDHYFSNYSGQYIPLSNYDFWLSKGRLKGFASSGIVISSSGSSSGIGDPSDKNNEIHKAVSYEDLGNLARDYADLYAGLPYVWGGESPYTYEVSIGDQKTNPNSIFKGVGLEKYQPSGNRRSGQLTVPGFDCSGFFWWIFKHAGLVDQRMTANGYYELAKTNWQKICYRDGCTKKFISDPNNVQQGDVLFIDPCDKGVCHIAIYVHDGRIVESTGSQGVVKRGIPESYYPGGSVGIEAIYRPNLQPVMPEATEQVTSEIFDAPPEPEEISYSLRPSFTIDIDYDLGDYKSLREDGYKLYTALDGCAPGKPCVREKLKELKLGWDLDCDGKDLAYYDMVEQIDLCSRSPDDNCLCRIDLEKKAGYESTDYGIALLKIGKQTGFIYDGIEYYTNSTLMIAKSFREDEDKVSVEPLPVDQKDITIRLSYGNSYLEEGYVEIPSSWFPWFIKSRIELSGTGWVYKDQEELAFIDIDDYHDPDFRYDTLERCSLPEERTYRFCVDSGKKVMAFDGGRLENRNIIYRFALRKIRNQ